MCLTTADGITAAGLLTRIALLDIRQRRPIGKITGMRSGNGVRSLQIAGSLLSAGYCNGQVTFHDLRTLQSLWPTCMFRDKPEVVANLQAPKGWAQSTWYVVQCCRLADTVPYIYTMSVTSAVGIAEITIPATNPT